MSSIPEIVEQLRQTRPEALGKVKDGDVARIVRAAFAHVAAELTKAPDGAVRFPGLGVFRIRTMDESDGHGGGRRLMYLPAVPKPDAAQPKPTAN